MNDSIKNLYGDMDENTFGVYLGHYVFDFPRTLIEPSYDVYNKQPNKICLNVYFAGKTVEEILNYYDIIKNKVDSELGKTGVELNQIISTPDRPKFVYCVIANDVDYAAQDILQDNFSIKKVCENSTNLFELARKAYCHYFSDVVKKFKKVGMHKSVQELNDNMLEDLIKANSLGYVKESVKEDIGPDQYSFWMIPVTIYETVPYEDGVGAEVKDYTIYYAARNKEETERYEKIINEKLLNEFNVEILGGKPINQDKRNQWIADGKNRASVKTEWPTNCYSVVAADFDFDSQDILQPDYSIKQNIANEIDPRTNTDYRFQKGLYSDLLKKAINVGIYRTEKEFQNHYFEDMVKLEKPVDECCCAGGMGGGVTTASFAPAVTHTVYPKPGKKKKKSKKEDNEFETIDDVYGFYSCTLVIWLKFPGSDTTVRKYYVVFGKDLDQIDKYNQIINNNIKQISKQSQILSTTLSDRIYSVAAKDFDFDSQKVLDPSLYVDNPKEFITSESIIQNDINDLNSKLIANCTNNLSEFFDNLFSQMTEDTDDVYWPVRNDETDAFEKMIKDSRKAKKEKIIARKERAINKRDETLFNWLRKMAAEDNYSTIAIHNKALKYNAVTDKMRADLEKIKKLPLDSPEFF